MTFYYDQPRNLLIYPRLDPLASARLLSSIQSARQVNGSCIAVPWNLRNGQILRVLDHAVPSIMDGYDWPRHPSIEHPYETQKLAANFMVLHPRCFNLSDMGTGKTLAALWAADWLMQRENFRALIVGPISIMQRVWADAIFKHFLNRRSYEILYGSAEQRIKLLERAADFYICNFDGVGVGARDNGKELTGFSAALAARQDIKLVIVDEASAYKDASTLRHRIARQVIGKRDYLWLMTGTPTPTAPTDAFGLAKLVNNAHGKSFRTFQLETMYKPYPEGFKWLPQRDGYDKARRLLKPSIRIDIKQVWDGPTLTTQQREIALTDEQKKHMTALKRDLVLALKSGEVISAANEAAARQKFIQVSLGAVYDEAHKAHLIDAKPRLEELRAVITEAPAKILILAQLTSIVNLLYKELTMWPREVVNGEVGERDRARIFQAFQCESKPRLLIADARALSHGLDLWMAQTVIWYGPTEQAEVYNQTNKRAHRPGQKFPVSVVQFVSTALEREIFRRLENNTLLQGALLDAIRRGEI